MVTNLANLVKATSSTALFRGSLQASVHVDTLACRYPLNKAVLDVASTKSARFGNEVLYSTWTAIQKPWQKAVSA